MRTTSEVDRMIHLDPKVRKFYKRHGNYVRNRSQIIFEDGATAENSMDGHGAMTPPPTDSFERAKLVCLYWEIRAKSAEDAFHTYKGALDGDGGCFVHESGEEEQLEKLSRLKVAATLARRKYRKAKQDVEDETPAWIITKRREEASKQRQRQKFHEQLSQYKL